MGQQDTTEAKIAAKHVTKITGQPTDRDLTLLKKELVKIAGKEATSLGGGKHGHIGILMKEDDYKAISNGGVEFKIPSHPGHHPTTLSTATGTREKLRILVDRGLPRGFQRTAVVPLRWGGAGAAGTPIFVGIGGVEFSLGLLSLKSTVDFSSIAAQWGACSGGKRGYGCNEGEETILPCRSELNLTVVTK